MSSKHFSVVEIWQKQEITLFHCHAENLKSRAYEQIVLNYVQNGKVVNTFEISSIDTRMSYFVYLSVVYCCALERGRPSQMCEYVYMERERSCVTI